MPPKPATIFITGSDTGAGKTVLTALLLASLRSRGVEAVAVKPFATGSPDDAGLLDALQDGALPVGQLAPFHFQAPVAPLLAMRAERRRVTLRQALTAIRQAQAPGRWLLIEGCGGLLTPLGDRFCARDLIAGLAAEVLVAVPNRLGAINQALLVCDALAGIQARVAAVVLMGCRRADHSVASNGKLLQELLAPLPVFEVPHLGPRAATPGRLRKAALDHRALLTRLAATLGRGA